ncbi:MFS transporter [Eubacterium sp.]|uniref:MFS transporter n=1 Tax=Eubacterium sp. TaxID=142586 RepID=UPI00258295B3|nr:MFS transporter [Eubacterium sp.]MCR5367543.1 MFS transporter [Eubacterium sp.]
MTDKKVNYKAILKESGYRKLLISTMINRFGDSLDAVAFTWLVYQVTHSGVWSAIIFGMNILPNVIVQPFAGAIVERLDKKKVIVITHIMRGLLLVGFLAVYLSGTMNGWIMAGFTFAVTSIEAFNMPASTAFIPKVIKQELLSHGLSFNTMMSGVVSFVGTGTAGVLIAKTGIFTVVIIDIVTFFIAAFIIMTIKVKGNNEEEMQNVNKEKYFTTLKEGLCYIKKESLIWNYCIIAVMLNFMLVPINALQAPLVKECYKMGSGLLSVIGMAGSVGAILGSALIPVVSKKFTVKKTILVFSFILGLGTMLLPMMGIIINIDQLKYIFAGVCIVIITLSVSFISGRINIEFISNVDSKYISRSSAVFVSLSTAAIPVTSMAVGWAKSILSTSTLIIICGIATVTFTVILMMINPKLDKHEEKIYEVNTI